jgi:hypothetical protein
MTRLDRQASSDVLPQSSLLYRRVISDVRFQDSRGPMNAPPLRFLMMIFAGWVNRHRQDAIEQRL